MDFGQQRDRIYQPPPELYMPPQDVHQKPLAKISHPSEFVNRVNPTLRASSGLTQYPTNSKEFHLEMLTQPLQSIATEWTDEKKPRSHKKRKSTDWPLEPAPVVALRIANGSELEHHNALTACPNVFCMATLMNGQGQPVSPETMRGRHSSSLIKLDKGKSPKFQTDAPAIGVFLFDQIHIRYPGQYCLLFTLFEMQMHDQGMHAVVHNIVRSSMFTVLPQPKRLPKPEPPAEILLALAAQGAKIKIRKPNEDRVKRKQDWSVDPNEQDFSSHTQMIPSMHSHLQNQLGPLPIPLTQPNFMQTTMAMVPPQYPMVMPTHTTYPMVIQTSAPQDMNFSHYPEGGTQFFFQGANPQNGFGGGFGGF